MENKNSGLEKITFGTGAFIRSEAGKNLRHGANFSAHVHGWNKLVEALDRHDSFAELLIDTHLYNEKTFRTPGGEIVAYGIPKQNFHDSNDEVILRHQKESAAEFLKAHRGFGLLADIVGSGKTFEAGIVLSELALRGLVSSMLIIVPEEVYGAWVRTIERFFGLGKYKEGEAIDADDRNPIVLKNLGKSLDNSLFESCDDGFSRPKYPMIVKMNDFVEWNQSDLYKKLFDVVVVDEAHHLNTVKGKDAKEMMLLSQIMQTKKEADKTYCLLLSATPHAGNLADMFRLWYFIRCKGGKPEDFRENTIHSAEFEDEYEFYTRNVCHGAITIMDFVRKQKISILRGAEAEFVKDFLTENPHSKFDIMSPDKQNAVIDSFLAAYPKLSSRKKEDVEEAKKYIQRFYAESYNKGISEYRSKFAAFLAERGYDDFDYNYEGLKEQRIDEFLSWNIHVKDEIKKLIAREYHGRVLRSIMIRQPQTRVVKPASRKKVVNLMYFRTQRPVESEIEIPGINNDSVRMSVDLGLVDFMNETKAFVPVKDGNTRKDVRGNEIRYTLGEYVDTVAKETSYSYGMAYGQILRNYLSCFDLSDMDSEPRGSSLHPFRFHKRKSVSYYAAQMSGMSFSSNVGSGGTSDVSYSFEPVYSKKHSFDRSDDFFFKMDKLKSILRKHHDQRVLIFFDYAANDEDKMAMPVYNELMASEEFSSRVIDVEQITEDTERENAFNKKSDAILVATESSLTEGANLQACSIIVNFQVTPNPLDMQQRIGRVFRLGQENDVIIYSIANMLDLEGYVLAYFTRIGLMSGNTGDAEILAGCNNDNMVTIRCPKAGCGEIELVSKEDVEARGKILCPRCNEAYLEEIVTRNIRCDNHSCRAVLARPTNSNDVTYMCISGNGGVMCNNGDYRNRAYYCHKICAISHCSRFVSGDMAGRCNALAVYRQLKNPTSIKIQEQCVSCAYKDDCRARGCIVGDGIDTISRCSTCNYASCSPKPHSIVFDSNWEATCPVCNRGKLKPVRSNTFESYIRELFAYNYDNGESFCDSFRKEIDKVIDIQDILKSDNLTSNN